MRGIGLHGLDQVGDEVGAAAQLHVDAAPALAHDVALADEPVEDDDGVEHDHDHGRGDHPVGGHCKIPVFLRVAGRTSRTATSGNRHPTVGSSRVTAPLSSSKRPLFRGFSPGPALPCPAILV